MKKISYKIVALLFCCLLVGQLKSQCTATFSTSDNGNGNISFTNLSVPASTFNITSYTWDFGDSQSSYQYSPTHSYASGGTYTVTLILNDTIAPCTSSISQVISVSNVTCNVNANFNYSIGSGGVVNFLNLTTGTLSSMSYSINFGDGNSAVFSPTNVPYSLPPNTYTTTGNFVVTLTADNFPGCSSTYSTIVNITNIQPCMLAASFSCSINNGTVTITNASTGTTSTTNYYWVFGNSNTSTLASPPPQTYTANGQYSIYLQLSDSIASTNCNSATGYTFNITNAACVANSIFAMAKDSSVTSSIVWNAYPTYPSNVSNVVWNWGDNTTSTGLYPSHTYSATGVYSICLTVSVSCGATSTSCLNTNIYRATNSQQIASVHVINTTTGLTKNNSASEIRLFPNPVKDILTIENSTSDFNVVVTDLYGKVVYTKSHSANDSKVDLQNLNSGIYFVKVSGADYSKSIKIIKE